jgi:hypothetical protein
MEYASELRDDFSGSVCYWGDFVLPLVAVENVSLRSMYYFVVYLPFCFSIPSCINPAAYMSGYVSSFRKYY